MFGDSPSLIMHQITTRALNRALLARQMLLTRERTTALEAVARLAGMQAQVPRPPFVGLWTRLEGFERAHLHALLHERRVVRATAMRCTIHLLTADDFAAFRGALQPALTRAMRSALAKVLDAMDVPTLEREGRRFFGEAPRTFDDFRKHLRGVPTTVDVRAIAYAVRTQVPLVQVPTDGTWTFPASANFTLADAWLGRPVPTEPSSPRDLVRRYLAAFGPATPRDAQIWSGLPALREVFEELRPELATFRDERGRELFDLTDAPRPADDAPAPVRFLPDYDNVILSHDDRARIIADEHRPLIVSRNLQVRATFLVDGFVAGAWKLARKKKTATLVIEPFVKIAKEVRAQLETEGEALLRFAEEDASAFDIRWTS